MESHRRPQSAARRRVSPTTGSPQSSHLRSSSAKATARLGQDSVRSAASVLRCAACLAPCASTVLAFNRPIGMRGPDMHDWMITTPDEMWAIDPIGCLSNEGDATVFVVVAHSSSECLGARVARRRMRFEAPTFRGIECLREAIHAMGGRYADNIAKGTKLTTIKAASSSRMPFRTSSKPSARSRARPLSASPSAMDLSTDSSGP